MTEHRASHAVLEACQDDVPVIIAFSELLLEGELRVRRHDGSHASTRSVLLRCPNPPDGPTPHDDAPVTLAAILGTDRGEASEVIVGHPLAVEADGTITVVSDGTPCGALEGGVTLTLGERTLGISALTRGAWA